MLSTHSKNMIWIFSGDTGGKLLGFIATVYLARVIGENGFGMVNISLAVMSYGVLFISGGIPVLGTQQVAQERIRLSTLAVTVTGLRLMLAVAAIAVITTATFLFVKTPALRTIIPVYSLFLIPLALMPEWYFLGKGQMGTVAAGRLFQMAIYLLILALCVTDIGDIFNVPWAWVAGGTGASLWLWHGFAGVIRQSGYRPDFRSMMSFWRQSIPLGIATVISQVALQFPFIYLGWRYGSTAAGHYGVAFRLMMALLVLDRIFYTVFFPAVSRQAVRDPADMARAVTTIVKSIAIAAITIGAVSALLAPWLIPLVFGEAYRPSVPLFQGMLGYFWASFLNSAVGYTLLAKEKYRDYTTAFVIALTVFAAALFVLPRWFEIIGICLALSLYQMTALVISTFYLKRLQHIPWMRGILLTSLGGGGLFFGLSAWLSLHPLALSVLGLLTVLPLTVWISGFGQSDFQYLRRALL